MVCFNIIFKGQLHFFHAIAVEFRIVIGRKFSSSSKFKSSTGGTVIGATTVPVRDVDIKIELIDNGISNQKETLVKTLVYSFLLTIYLLVPLLPVRNAVCLAISASTCLRDFAPK